MMAELISFCSLADQWKDFRDADLRRFFKEPFKSCIVFYQGNSYADPTPGETFVYGRNLHEHTFFFIGSDNFGKDNIAFSISQAYLLSCFHSKYLHNMS